MTTTSASKNTAPAFQSPTVTNLKPAIFWLDDRNKTDPGKSVVLLFKKSAKLSAAQWARRTPAQWGVLAGDESISVANVPAADVAAFEAAEEGERARLATVSIYNDTERAVMSNKLHINT